MQQSTTRIWHSAF